MDFRALVHRIVNLGTLVGLVAGPTAALLVALSFSGGDVPDGATVATWYFSVQYVGVFLLARLLPFRGLRAVRWAVAPALGLAALAFWWGGLGAGAALIAALAIPDRPVAQLSG